MNKNNKNTKGFDDMKSNRRGKVLSLVLVLMMVLSFTNMAYADEVKAKDFETKSTTISFKDALEKGYVYDASGVKLPFNAEFSINEVTLDKDTKQFKADIKVEDKLNAFNGLNFVVSTRGEGFVNIKDITYNIEDKSDIITSEEYVNGNQHFGFLDTNNKHNEVNATITFEYTNDYTDDTEAIITLEQVEVLFLNEGKVFKNAFLPKDVIKASRLEKYEPYEKQTIEINVDDKVKKAEVTVLKEQTIPNTIKGVEKVMGIFEQIEKNIGNAKVTNETLDDGTEIISIDLIKEVDVTVNGENLKLEEIIYDKTKMEFIPIYSPENNFEEAIYTDFEHGVDFLMVVNRYPVSVDEAYCVFVESYGNTCVNFNGLKYDKSPFKEYDYIWMYLIQDFETGTRYDVLKERWGIDDNYIKYKLEPASWFSAVANQEEMDWSYTYFR